MAHRLPNRGKNTIMLMSGTVILIVFTLAIAMIFFAQTNAPGKEVRITQTVTPKIERPTIAPTATPEPLNKTVLKVEVLNGSGVSGTAGRAARSLKALGFTNADTGNADKLYLDTQVSFSTDISSVHSDEILKDIKSLYPGVIVSNDTPQSSSSVRLIIGRN